MHACIHTDRQTYRHYRHTYKHTYIIPLGISSIKLGGYLPDKNMINFIHIFRSFLGLGCSSPFYRDFFGGSGQHFIVIFTCWVTATYNVIGSHSIETTYSGKLQFSNVMGSHFILAEAVITPKKHTSPYHTIPYPTHPIKTQPIQLGAVLRVHVSGFNCQGRRVSTSDLAQVYFSEFAKVFFGEQK